MSSDRTEKPTERRRTDARKRGQVARSRDLNDAFHLGAALLVLAYWGPTMIGGMQRIVAIGFGRIGDARHHAITSGEVVNLAVQGIGQLAWLVAPMAVAAVVATAASTQAQGGFIFASEALTVDFKRLNPSAGLKRLLPSQAGVNLLKTLIAATIVGAVAWSAVHATIGDAPRLALLTPGGSVVSAWEGLFAFLERAAITLIALAALDFGLQTYRTTQSLRMTKQEVKDDMKMAEGNPQIKARVRRVQREMVRRRMLAAVPKATVVVTNPTHFAVALQYQRGQAAPEVVAKGADALALKIRSIAREHGVPIVENPPLARAIYKQVDVGEFIPGDLFEAVAEVLAYLIRMKQVVL
ncbi:MAG: flagellar biosynthesis protein FlhB [Acidobacteria bacterium]|nr:flagellar biosynthesis protein FlhB [Acidobacteriota bacterium]